jgi:hypothetical protein
LVKKAQGISGVKKAFINIKCSGILIFKMNKQLI